MLMASHRRGTKSSITCHMIPLQENILTKRSLRSRLILFPQGFHYERRHKKRADDVEMLPVAVHHIALPVHH